MVYGHALSSNVQIVQLAYNRIMDPLQAIDFFRIFIGEQTPPYYLEIMFRVIVVYIIGLLFLRAGGKRARKQLTPMNMLLLVAVGSIIGDAMFTPYLSMTYVFLIMSTVMVMQYASSRLVLNKDWFEDIVNSTPHMMVKHGKICKESLMHENMTEDELFSELRMNGVRHLGEVEYAFLELSGAISVFKYENKEEVKIGQHILPLDDPAKIKI